jgi:hypothetical protein
MDVSFEPTMMQWGDGETNTQFQSSTSAFEKVPLPVTVSDVVNCQSDDDKIHLGMYSFATVS